MLALRSRGVFGPMAIGLIAVLSACSNGTEPKQITCDAANPVTLSPGEVQTPLPGTCVYISGGSSGGEFALVPFNGDTAYAKTVSLNFSSNSVSPIATPLKALLPDASALFSAAPGVTNTTASMELSPSYELQLRESERRVLRPLIPGARAWYANRFTRGGTTTGIQPSFSISAATWAVGDTVDLNAKSGSTLAAACQTPDIRAGRVAAITDHAIVVADTGNPAGGYTDAEYLGVGIQFDSVYTMDVNAFGAPTDIDSNGKIILFFTRAVNELTPRGSTSVVGGFFYGRDLFPKVDSPELGPGSGCPTSNVAEMFYLLVPDPNGVVNGNVRTKTSVSRSTVSTTAHEFQHLINASRRLYVNTAATDFEVVWLNEGLSHIAEELLFYQQSAGLTPRMDIDSVKIRADQRNVNAYNFDEQANFGRMLTYLQKPASSSPYAPNDSLETRGATWLFLRYAADHRGTSDGDTWFKLVNSTTTGIQNLQNVFGSGLPTIFRDWSVATIADNVPGVGNEWQHPSWNFRSMWVALTANSSKSYPLSTVTVGDGSPVTVSLNGGSAAYVRFTVAAGQTGSITWGITPSTVAMSVVRLK